MNRIRAALAFLMNKGDPIGNFLGRTLLLPIVRIFWKSEEERQRKSEEIHAEYDPLHQLGISTDPPAVWKSLLWWAMWVVGIALAFYVSAHLR